MAGRRGLDALLTYAAQRIVERAEAKAATLPFVPEYLKTSWLTPTFQRMAHEGYASNAAVFQVLAVLAKSYPEPPLEVRNMDGEPQPGHPLQQLLDRPNPVMSWAEMMLYIIVYKGIGGQIYLHKVRNGKGPSAQVVELWPYHAGQIMPVPSQFNWVDHYEYDLGDGKAKVPIPAQDVIHLKWPSIDLEQPWLSLPPLRAIAQEVDSDSQMTRYLWALLKNDATPRTVITMPQGQGLTEVQFTRMKQQFMQRHGGDNRGGVGVLEGGATLNRMSLSMQELAWEALRRIPESRIAGAFGVPAILAGLYVGLEKATYANYREARAHLTENTLVPMWKSDAVELTQALANEFGGNIEVHFDLSKVAALQEAEDSKNTRVVTAYDKGIITKNEARTILGFVPVGEMLAQADFDPEGDVFKAAPVLPAMQPQPNIVDVTPPPDAMPMLPPPKQYPYPLAIKALRDAKTEPIESKMQKVIANYLAEQYQQAAGEA
jgi:HK97 family phage portal protein